MVHSSDVDFEGALERRLWSAVGVLSGKFSNAYPPLVVLNRRIW